MDVHRSPPRFAEAAFNGDAQFRKTSFGGKVDFTKAMFRRNHPPVWPDGFAEPAWTDWQGSRLAHVRRLMQAKAQVL